LARIRIGLASDIESNSRDFRSVLHLEGIDAALKEPLQNEFPGYGEDQLRRQRHQMAPA